MAFWALGLEMWSPAPHPDSCKAASPACVFLASCQFSFLKIEFYSYNRVGLPLPKSQAP